MKAQKRGAVSMTDEAAAIWRAIYPALTEEEAGVVAALTSRSAALAKRLALLYAVLDDWQSEPFIGAHHLRAALAIIDFSRDSARHIYGAPGGNKARDKLCRSVLKAISTAQDGLTQTELQNALNRNVDASKLWSGLEHLQAVGKLTQTVKKTNGRPKTVWTVTKGFNLQLDELNEIDE